MSGRLQSGSIAFEYVPDGADDDGVFSEDPVPRCRQPEDSSPLDPDAPPLSG